MPHPIDILEDGRTTVLMVGGRKVHVHQGDLLDIHADAIICPVDPVLDLSRGLAKELTQAAGPQFRKEKPVTPEPFGKVIVMPAGKLNVKFVFLGVILGHKTAEKRRQAVQQVVDRAVRYAEFLKLKSLAFPLLGCSSSTPPYQTVAREMLEQITLYLQRRRTKIKTVFFTAFNAQAYAAFQKEAKNIADL